MCQFTRKNLKQSFLTRKIQQLLYKPSSSSLMIFGMSFVMSGMLYAAPEIQPVDNVKDEIINQAIIDQEKKQLEIIQQTQQEQQKIEDQTLNESLAIFQQDDVYQLQAEPTAEVNEAMLAEIYQIAEQAQQDAVQQSQALKDGLVQQLITEQTTPDITDPVLENNQEQQVSELVTTLSQDKVNLPEIMADRVQTSEGEYIQTRVEPKRTWLDKLLGREAIDKEEIILAIPKIDVTVVLTGETTNSNEEIILKNNIDAMLSTFTVEAFEDFSVALPQLRSMTKKAAEAVGYYQAEFKFNKIDEDHLQVLVVPNQPTIVNQPKIEILGDGQTRPAFRVISVVPDLREGDVLNHEKYETIKSRVVGAASDLGYFDSVWLMHDVKVNQPENTADIQLKYNTGDRYKLHDVEFRMMGERKEFPLKEEVLRTLVPFQDNDDYSSWRINGLSSNLTNSRYFNFTLVNVIKPDPIQEELELPADLQELAQQQAQQVENNPSETEQEVLEQNVVSEDIFAGEDNKSEQRERMTLIDAQEEENEKLRVQARLEQKIPVIVYLNADHLNNVEAGIGYGTDTGIRFRSQYRRAIVNDLGHSFDANIELSEIRQSFDGRYMIPYNHPLNDYISLVGGYEREVRDQIGQGIELDIESAVLGAERIIKRPLGSWQHNMSMRYRLDRIDSNGGAIDYEDLPDAFKIITSSPEQESLLFGYEISKTNQNNRVNPTQGFRQFYRAEVGSESLLTETDLAIINAGWRFIYSLGDNADHQFVGRADAGYIFTDNFDQVPYNLRYFAGGDQSIRGYDYKSLAPREDNLLLGGQALMVGSLEYNYQFKEGWRGAIFTDVGNAYDEKFSNETKYGVGVGIRWASPVGPIRIDVGAGVSEQSIPIRLHFFIGPAL